MDYLEKINFFIEMFSAIPEEKWIEHEYINSNHCACALGHCILYDRETLANELIYSNSSPTAQRLRDLFRRYNCTPNDVNDGFDRDFQQPTPKQRVLAALEHFKKIELSLK